MFSKWISLNNIKYLTKLILLDELLNSSAYGQVTVVVRKKLNIQHPKLKTLLGDCAERTVALRKIKNKNNFSFINLFYGKFAGEV